MDELRLVFENVPVRLVASRNIPRMETAGILIEETEASKELIVSLWLAWELVEAGLARFADFGVSNDEWTQIHYRERFQPRGRLAPLPDRYYPRVYLTFKRLEREAGGDSARLEGLNRLRGMYRDILESRINRIVRLASAEAKVSSTALQPEEVPIYDELHGLVSSWRRKMRGVALG
jgi:hypothetical protein